MHIIYQIYQVQN